MLTATRRTSAERAEMQAEALSRATSGLSVANFAAIFEGLTAKGIDPADIRPRENVLTYHAWAALGRQVRKGEKGVQVVTWIPLTRKDYDTGERKPIGKRCRKAYVFHVSQTDPA